jgi:tRNA pseudouridine38-40 synthase
MDRSHGSVVRLLVGYDGTNFAGYQIQPDQRTVQGEIEAALEQIARRPVRVRAAGRTDAGVHALGQVVSISSDQAEGLDADVLMRAMPSLLPADVAVLDAQTGPEGFDARHSAEWRSYVYLLWAAEAPNPLYRRFALWTRDRIDREALAGALRSVVGTHDFTSFGRVREDQTPERRVIEATAVADGPFIRIRVTGESFLHQMVRSLVGTALEIGTGRKPVEWMGEVLDARDRAAAGPVAQPHGLALTDVGYRDADWPRRLPVGWPWSDRVPSLSERGCA